MRRRTPRASAPAMPLLRAARWTVETLEARTLLTAVWSGQGDAVNWTDPRNWSGGVLPGPNDSVIISTQGTSTVKLATGNQVVQSVTTNTPLTIAGGSLAVLTTLQTSSILTLSGGMIQNADIVAQGAGQFVASGSGAIVGVKLDCPSTVLSRTSLTVQNGLTVNNVFTLASDSSGGTTVQLSGAQTLAGTGQILLGGTAPNNNLSYSGGVGAPLTVSQGLTIHGKGTFQMGGGTLFNQGSIVADSPGQTLTLSAGSMTNEGTLVTTQGGTLNVSLPSGWSNVQSGRFDVEGGTLQLGGAFSTSGINLPTFTRSGGTVTLTGTLDNSNSTLPLSASTGSWNLSGTINGGQISEAGGAQLVPANGTLVGVTLDNDVTIPTRTGLFINSGLTLNSAVLTIAADTTGGSTLNFQGTQTVSGVGAIDLAGTSPNNSLSLGGGSAATLTIGSGITVHGQGTIDVGAGTLLNEGTVASDSTSQFLNINNGTMNNQGVVLAAGPLALNLNNGFANGPDGRLKVEGGALSLNGTLTTAGLNLPTFVRNGGTVSIGGSLNNTNATLALSTATGPWTLADGTITGGDIRTSSDAPLVLSSGTLVGVTIDTDETIPTGSSISVQNGLTVNATLSIASDGSGGSSLTFRGGGQTLGGLGEIFLGGTGNSDSLNFVSGGADPLTIAAGFFVHGKGTIDLGAGTLVNLGDIAGDAPGQTLTVTNGSLSNQGILEADQQATLTLNLGNGLTASGQGNLDVEGGTLNLGGTLTTAALNLPAFVRNGGSVNLTGALDNTNSTLALSAATGSWTLAGGTISGGHVATSGGAQLIPSSGAFNGVVIDSDVTIPAHSTLQIQGGLTLNATLTVSGDTTGAAQLSFLGTETVSGTGQIAMTGAANNVVSINASDATVTLGPQITLHGWGTVQGLANTTLANQGTIVADVQGQTLQITVPNFTSQGTATSANGGILSISSIGAIQVGTGNVTLGPGISPTSLAITGGNVTFLGTLPVSLASLTLGGGSLGGTAPITLTGPATWTAGTITLDAPLTIATNTTLTVSGTAPHLATSPVNNAGAVNLTDGTLQLDGGGAQTGSFTLSPASVLSLGGNAAGSFAATSSVSGQGTFLVQDSAAVIFTGAYNVGATTVSGGGILELIPGARVASIGTLTVDGGTFSCGNAGLAAAPALRGKTGPVPGTVNVLSAVVLGGGITLVEPGWTLSVGAGGVTFTGATSPEIHLVSDPILSGRLLLGGDVTFAGSGGTGAILSVGTAAVPGQVDLGGAQRSFVVNDGSSEKDLSIAANITDGSMRSSGSGRVQLGTASAFSGGITIAGGVAEIDDAAGLGSGTINFAGGTLAFGPSVSSLSNPFTAAPSDSISLDVGAASPQLQSVAAGSALKMSGLPGGSLVISGPVTLQHDLTINNSVPVTISGAITGPFALTKTGTGSLTFSGSSGNTYSGMTSIDGGSLVLNKPGSLALAVPGNLTINGPAAVTLAASFQISPGAAVVLNSARGPALLDLAGHDQALESISSALPASTLSLGSGSLSLARGGATCAFAGSITGAGTLIKIGSGTLTLGPGASLQGAALEIDGGTVACAPGGGAANTIRSLVIAHGGRMDLGNTTLRISYGGGPSPAGTIESYMTTAFAGGAWSGPGLGTSTVGLTLGFGDSADGIVAGLPANTLVVKPALPGDTNLDGTVNFTDLLNLAQHYGQAAVTWDHGDANYDATVNFTDLLLLAQHYGQTAAFVTTDATPWLAKSSHRLVQPSGRRAI